MQAYDVKDYGMVCFDGEITLTGILERSDNSDIDTIL